MKPKRKTRHRNESISEFDHLRNWKDQLICSNLLLHNLFSAFVRFMTVTESCSMLKIKSNNTPIDTEFIFRMDFLFHAYAFRFWFFWCDDEIIAFVYIVYIFFLYCAYTVGTSAHIQNIMCLNANELIMLFNVGHSKMMVILFMFTTTIWTRFRY